MTTSEYKTKFPGHEVMCLTQAQYDKVNATRRTSHSKHKDQIVEKNRRTAEMLASGAQLLKCQICEFTSACSLISHICKIHSITMQDYRTKFPNCTVQQSPPSVRENSRRLAKKRLEDPEKLAEFIKNRSFPSEIKHWTKKGFSEEDAVKKVAEFQRTQSLKGNNEVTHEKRSKKSTGALNPMSLQSIAQRFGVSIQEARELTPCFGRSGDKHPMFGKHHTIESLAKIANAPHLTHPSQRSIPEIEIAEFISSFNSTAQFNVGSSRWNIDVKDDLTKTVVEHFGCMWHAHHCMKWLPTDNHPIYGCLVEKILDRNQRKLQYLTTLGYHVVIVWECEWHSNKELQQERIKNAFNRI